MEHFRLWRYQKLANENVKDEETDERSHSDVEDYNSCFKLKTTLKKSCKKLLMSHSAKKMSTVDEFATRKIIKKLKEQQKDKQETELNRKTLRKCLHKILSKNHQTHQKLKESHEEKLDCGNVYLDSGIYDKFGNSCTESLVDKTDGIKCESEYEDLSACGWYQSGLTGKLSLEMLKLQSPGSFIIHRASNKSTNFILSVRIHSKSGKVVHHLIVHTKRGYRIKGESKFFPTISSLVTHHSVMAETLPVTLMIQKPANLVKRSNNDDFSSIDDLKISFTDLEI